MENGWPKNEQLQQQQALNSPPHLFHMKSSSLYNLKGPSRRIRFAQKQCGGKSPSASYTEHLAILILLKTVSVDTSFLLMFSCRCPKPLTNQNPFHTIDFGITCFLFAKCVALPGFQWWKCNSTCNGKAPVSNFPLSKGSREIFRCWYDEKLCYLTSRATTATFRKWKVKLLAGQCQHQPSSKDKEDW